MAKRKKKSEPKDLSDGTWFDSSTPAQVFLWRLEPANGYILLGGNRLGYEKMQRALKRIIKGSNQASVKCNTPDLAPPIQWRNSPLARRKEAPIHEIEKDLRSTVSPFKRFVWYRSLTFVLGGDGDVTCLLRGEELNVILDPQNAEELQTLLEDSTFPMFGGVLIGSSRGDKHVLMLSGDWLGAE